MNKKFLRLTLLVRIILENNGKLDFEAISKELLKKFETYYNDVKSLQIVEFPSFTFERDKKLIRDLWKIDLQCIHLKYSIDLDSEGIFNNDLLNSALFLASLNADMLLPTYVVGETRKNTGMIHFSVIAKAIEEKKRLKISYFDYISQKENSKTINPYLLKQKDFKWYVLADDEKKDAIPFKSYALERIKAIEILNSFKQKNIDFNSPFQDSIGMFTNGNAEKIILQYDLRDGNYLKANPIDASQKIILENNEHIQFEFFVKPNEDFIMELMKRSWSLKVIEPTSLKSKIKDLWKSALERNK